MSYDDIIDILDLMSDDDIPDLIDSDDDIPDLIEVESVVNNKTYYREDINFYNYTPDRRDNITSMKPDKNYNPDRHNYQRIQELNIRQSVEKLVQQINYINRIISE
jgi:hypothetical protein